MSKRNRKGRSYPPEFREQLIELARVGRTPRSLAQEFGVGYQTVLGYVAPVTFEAKHTVAG